MIQILQNCLDFHPVRLLLLLLPLVGITTWWGLRRGFPAYPLWLALAVGLVLVTGLADWWWYATSPLNGWPIEPHFLSVAEEVRRGGPLYPDPGRGAAFYAQLNGPSVYFGYAGVFAMAGASYASAKLASALFMLMGVSLAAVGLFRHGGVRLAFPWVMFVVVVLGAAGIYGYGIRPEPLIFLGMGLALLGLSFQGWRGWLLFLLGGALVLSCKPTGAWWLFPLLAWALVRRGWVSVPVGAAMPLLALAWFLSPQASFPDYLLQLKEEMAFPFAWLNFGGFAQQAMILFVPFLVAAWPMLTKKAPRILVLREWLPWFVCLLSVAGLYSGVGRLLASSHHLLPFAFVGAWLAVDAVKRSREVVNARRNGSVVGGTVLAASALAFALPFCFASYNRGLHAGMKAAAAESEAIVAEIRSWHELTGPGLQVGVGEGFVDGPGSPTPYRAVLIMDGEPLYWDPTAAMEMPFRGLDPTVSLENLLRSGQVKWWLIPQGEKPFQALSSYDKMPFFREVGQWTEGGVVLNGAKYFSIWKWEP